MILSCPGKIFIIGEYSCLVGNKAILASVGPRYELITDGSTNQDLEENLFHPNSPAGKFIKILGNSDKNLKWIDHQMTQGSEANKIPMGFGSSSAQFLLSYSWFKQNKFLPEDLLKKYWELTTGSEALRPSGLDLLNQFFGGVNLLSAKPNTKITRKALTNWNEETPTDSLFILAHTGRKESTHHHLENLKQLGFPQSYTAMVKELDLLVDQAAGAWEQGKAHSLGQILSQYQTVLDKYEIAPKAFSSLVEKISQISGVLGCKGSGAQGGDCILILIDKSKMEFICTKIKELSCTPIFPQWDQAGLTQSH